ncbi:MAG: HDOD domain-containing protein [Gammaproteobacteria bacterium]|nr:HDOD domain-containing protein [Gammaproteobacteria bacterium]
MSAVTKIQAEPALLAGFSSFNECSAEQLTLLADHAWLHEAPRGHVLMELNRSDGWDYYLLKGTMKLVAGDGAEQFIMGSNRGTRVPLQPRRYAISAMTPVKYLRVETALLGNLIFGGLDGGLIIDAPEGDEQVSDSPLYAEIYDDLLHDRLVVPSMPEVALKVRRMIEKDDAPIPELARAIHSDPAISAKLIKAANGALYHGQPKVESCARAVARLGLGTTKHLVVSIVLGNLFQEKIKTDLLNDMARELWVHSVEVGVISMMLARVTPGLDAEEAMLAGLVHDIGELVILSYADNYPDINSDRRTLEAVIARLKGEIGAKIMREWQFPEDFASVARDADDWLRDAAPEPDYCDVVLVAQLHSYLGSPKMDSLPGFSDVPAFGKLANGELSPEDSRQILEQAKEQIHEIKRWLAH